MTFCVSDSRLTAHAVAQFAQTTSEHGVLVTDWVAQCGHRAAPHERRVGIGPFKPEYLLMRKMKCPTCFPGQGRTSIGGSAKEVSWPLPDSERVPMERTYVIRTSHAKVLESLIDDVMFDNDVSEYRAERGIGCVHFDAVVYGVLADPKMRTFGVYIDRAETGDRLIADVPTGSGKFEFEIEIEIEIE
jgi:hypothetical protein